MSHVCEQCERSFVMDTALAAHVATVHADAAAAVPPKQFPEGFSPEHQSQYVSTPAGERRKIIEVDGGPGGYTTRVVKDFNDIADPGPGGEERQHSDVLAGVRRNDPVPTEMADADDTPEGQAYLMQAWTALAMYLAQADDTDRQPAMEALKMVSNLISGIDQPNQAAPAGAFGLVARAAQDTWTCPQCSRTFSSEAGLLNHLKTVHAQREKETTNRTEKD